MRELLMHHDVKLEIYPFRGPLLINKKAAIEHLFKNSHKNGSRSKDFNNNIDTSSSAPPKATIVCHKPKVNLVLFVDPYNHINLGENTNDNTNLIGEHEEHTRDDYEEEETLKMWMRK